MNANHADPDPDLARLAPGEPGWRVAYRMDVGARFSLTLMGFIAAFLFLMLGALVVFGVFLAIQQAGGTGPFLRSLVRDHGCGTLMGLVLLFFVVRALGYALRTLLGFLRDLGSKPEIWHGEVEALRKGGGYRGAARRLLVLRGRVFDITEELYKSLREGEPVVAEVRPHGPTLLLLLTKEHGTKHH